MGRPSDCLEYDTLPPSAERGYTGAGDAMGTKTMIGDKELMRLPKDGMKYELVDGEIRGLPAVRIAANACEAGAYVAARAGAMPAWSDELKGMLGISR